MITGKHIKELRESAGITQLELAAMANVSQAHIAKIESEKVNPRLSTVNTLLDVLQKQEKKVLCNDVMSRKVVSLKPTDSAKKSVSLMKSFDISQLPVVDRSVVVGAVTESTIIKHLDKNLLHVKVKEIMDEPFPIVSEDDSVDMLPNMLEFRPAVLVAKKGKVTGIITKFDLLGARDAR
jgi:predicted transcriptional regulator